MTVSDDKPRAHAKTATEESALPLDGGEIHVYRDGPRDAPALLLIHGTAASALSWDPMVPLLTGSCLVIRIDLPGCGRSARPDDASYAVPDQAGRVAAALDRLGVRPRRQPSALGSRPFPDGSSDIVTSALAIHNIPSPGGRYRAADEAMRVLRPGGKLLIADPWPMTGKYAAHIGQGTLRSLGPGYWYGGPWLGITLLHAVKER